MPTRMHDARRVLAVRLLAALVALAVSLPVSAMLAGDEEYGAAPSRSEPPAPVVVDDPAARSAPDPPSLLACGGFDPPGDKGGASFTISSSCTTGGTYTNIGTFTVNAGVTVTVTACGNPCLADQGFLSISAAVINIQGTINADGAGPRGGSTGSTGQGSGGGTGGGTGQAPQSSALSGATSFQSGAGGGGGGGGQGGFGASHGGSAGIGGSGGGGKQGGDGGGASGISGGLGGSGASGGTGRAAYGSQATHEALMGSGGGGGGSGGSGGPGGSAGGGCPAGGSGLAGGAGGTGGAGGGAISLIASSTLTIGSTATLAASGAGGGSGSGGNNNVQTGSGGSTCSSGGAGAGSGAGGGGGGGSGGTVLLDTDGLTFTGTPQLRANGGSGASNSVGGSGAKGGDSSGSSSYCGGGGGGGGGSSGSGAGGAGGRIKVFYQTSSGAPSQSVTAGAAGSSGAGGGNAGGAGSNAATCTSPVATSGTSGGAGTTGTSSGAGTTWSDPKPSAPGLSPGDSWQTDDFSILFSFSDPGGTGLANCYYSVDDLGRGGLEIPATSIGCPSPTVSIAVGPADTCRNTGTNMCRVESWATDTSGSTGAKTTVDYDINLNSPDAPTGTLQFRSDGTTPISTGGWTPETSVVLKFSMSDPDANELLTPYVEVKPIATPFDGTGLTAGAAVSAPVPGVPVTGTVPVSPLGGGEYHWRARVVDMGSIAGPFTSAMGNADGVRDFGVDTTAPNVPTLLSPFDNRRGGSWSGNALRPIFRFTTTDPQGNPVRYQIQVDDSSDFSSPAVNAVSGSAAGFVDETSGAVDPFPSGDTISFTVQADAVSGVVYYWRVRAVDPTGSGVPSAYSAARSLAIDSTVTIERWLQTTQAQFDTDTFADAVTTADGDGAVTLGTGTAGYGTSGAFGGYFSETYTNLDTCAAATATGRIVRWSVDANAVGISVRLKVFRDDGTNYVFVGQTGHQYIKNEGVNTFTANLSVLAGDLIATQSQGAAGGVNNTGTSGCRAYWFGDIQATALKSSWATGGPQARVLASIVVAPSGHGGAGTHQPDSTSFTNGNTIIDHCGTITSTGILTAWSVRATGAGNVKLKVFRDNGPQYDFVGETVYQSVPGPGVHVYNAAIAVQAGDIVGFYAAAPNVGGRANGAGCYSYKTVAADETGSSLKTLWTSTTGNDIMLHAVVTTQGKAYSSSILYADGPSMKSSWARVGWSEDSTFGDVSVAVESWSGDAWVPTGLSQTASPMLISSLGSEAQIRLVATLTYIAGAPKLFAWEVTWNGPPVNDRFGISVSGSGIRDGGRVYPGLTDQEFKAYVSHPSDGSFIDHVDLRLDGTVGYVVRWDQNTDTFVEGTGGAYYDILSTGADSTYVGNQWTIVFRIKFGWDLPWIDTSVDPAVRSENAGGAFDLDTFTLNSYSVEDDLYFRETQLRAHWRFDEGVGSAAGDASGLGNAGTLSCCPPLWVEGKVGKALDFDGVDDSVDVPDNELLEPSTALSVEAWLKLDTYEAFDRIIDKSVHPTDSPTSSGYALVLDAAGENRASFQVYVGDPSPYRVCAGTIGSLTTGAWHHLAGTYDGTDLKFYQDGVELCTSTYGSSVPPIANSRPLSIGKKSSFAFNHIDGSIDEVKVWGRVLSPAEIAEHAGLLVNDDRSGLVAEYKMDEYTVGTTTRETSGSASNGTISGGPVGVPGKYGRALQFNQNNKVDISGLKVNTVIGSGAKATVEFWMHWDGSAGASSEGVMPFGWGPEGGQWYDLWLKSSVNCFGFNTGSSDIYGINIPANLANSWHHVAAVFYNGVLFNNGDVNQPNVALYIDGIPQKLFQCTQTTSGSKVMTDVARIGRAGNYDNQQYSFSGRLDEFRIWNRELSWKEIAGHAGLPQNDYDSGLVADLRFSEGSGTAVQDFSGNGNGGTLCQSGTCPLAGPTWWSGRSGWGLSFDGANDYVEVAHSSTLMQKSVSAEAWIHPRSYTNIYARVLEKGGANAGGGYGIEFNPGNNLNRVRFLVWNGVAFQGVDSLSVIPINAWTHVAGTFDGCTMRLFVNGIEEGTLACATMTSNTARLAIGRSSWTGSGACPGASPDCHFDGVIDEVRVYDRALSASEVAEHAGFAAQDRESDLVGNWRFLETSGNVAFDSSSSVNTANLVNGATRAVGPHGGAVKFDGFDDHVNAGKRASLDSAIFTAAFWVKGDTAPGGGAVTAVLKKHSSDISDAETFSFIWHHFDPLFQQSCVMNTVPGSTWVKARLTTPLAANVWHHVTCTYDGTNLKAYLNGALETTVGSGLPSVGTSSFIIGGGGTSGNSPSQFFTGTVDEVRVYNQALAAAEVAALPDGIGRSALASGLRVSGSSHLSGDTWAKAGDALAWSGLSVYFEGGLVQPLDGDVDIRVRDDAGNKWVQTVGLDLGQVTSADSSHDTSDIHEIDIIRTPAGNGFLDRRAFELKIDGLAPEDSPKVATADGSNPSPWKDSGTFSIDWGNPADDSDIAGIWWKANADPVSPTDGTLVMGRPANVATGLGSGTHSLKVWLEDFVGNRDHTKRSDVTLRIDETPVSYLDWAIFEDGDWRPLTDWRRSNRLVTLRATITADLSGVDADLGDMLYRYTSDGVLDSEAFSFAHAPNQFFDGVQGGPNGWGPVEVCDTAGTAAPWAIGTQAAGYYQVGTSSWFVDEPNTATTQVLTSPVVSIPPDALNAKLRFFHRMQASTDHGWLEFSANGGPWTAAAASDFELGGYNYESTASGWCGPLAPPSPGGFNTWGGIVGAGAMAETVVLLPPAAVGGTVQWRYVFRTDASGAAAEPNGWWLDAFEVWGNYVPSVHTCASTLACPAASGATGTLYVKIPSIPYAVDSGTLNKLQLRLKKVSGPLTSADSLVQTVRIDTLVPGQNVITGAYTYSADPGSTVDVDHSDPTSGLDEVEARFFQSWPTPPSSWSNTIVDGAAGSPSRRSDHVAVVDEETDRVILFGGEDVGIGLRNDLWLLTGASSGSPTWTQMSPTGTLPAARSRVGAVYDQANSRMIMFGGYDGSPKNDVWVLSYANGLTGTPSWTLLGTAGGPPAARYAMNVHYNPTNNRLVVFGGYSNEWLNDVWVLTFANGLGGGTPTWTQLSPTGGPPSVRCCYASGYDPVSNRLVVSGGQTTGAAKLGDVWVLRDADGTGGTPSWASLAPSGSGPSARINTASAYDTGSDRLMIFGGDDGSKRNAVYVLENASGAFGSPRWRNTVAEGAAGSPSVRSDAFGVFLPGSSKFLMFGGMILTGTRYNDVWLLSNANALGPATPFYTVFGGLGGAAAQTADFNLWIYAPVGGSRVQIKATDIAGNVFDRRSIYYEAGGEPVSIGLRLGTNLVGWSATLTNAYGNFSAGGFGRAIMNSTGMVAVEVGVYEPGVGWVTVTSADGVTYFGASGDPLIDDGEAVMVRMSGPAGSYPVTFAGTGRPITSPVNIAMGNGAYAITVPEKTGGGSYTGTTLLDAISADISAACSDEDTRCAYNVLKFDALAQQWMQVTWDCSFFCGYTWSHEDFAVAAGDGVFVFVAGAPGAFTFTP